MDITKEDLKNHSQNCDQNDGLSIKEIAFAIGGFGFSIVFEVFSFYLYYKYTGDSHGFLFTFFITFFIIIYVFGVVTANNCLFYERF